MNAVDKHPQRQQIIDGILAGATLRKLAATLDPPLHYATLSRFRLTLLGNAGKNIHARSATAAAIKEMATGKEDPGPAIQRAKTEVQQGLQKLAKRVDGWIGNAEQVADDGQLNHRALALHARNSLTALELKAKLEGLLQHDAATLQANINIALILPRAEDLSSAAASEQPIIDVTGTPAGER
jgi:hypothetical protein